MEKKISMDQGGGGGDGLGMIEAHYIYCSLYFHYYCISSTSDRQAVDHRGWLLLLLLLLSHFSRVRLCETPQTAAHQVPPSLGFSRQEHWSGLPFPSLMHESEK